VATDEREEGEALIRQLSAEAAVTRARLASDIDALGDKLAPRNLKIEAKSRARRMMTAGLLAIAQTARRHPLPVALSLLGVGVLVWRAHRA
jgi:hypothetical protein